MITVRYSSVDGYRQSRRFKTLDGARKYAHKWTSPTPEVGIGYAISPDGIGMVRVEGVSLQELFPLPT